MDTAINYLPGIGPARAKLLEAELGIRTWRDLLYTFPYKHIDRSRLYKIRELTADMPFVQVMGQFRSFEEAGQGRKHRLTGHFWDGEMFVDVTWFNGIRFIKQSVKTDRDYILFGRPSVFSGRLCINHPDLDKPESTVLSKMSMQPYYMTTERMKKAGVTSRTMERFTSTLLGKLTAPLPETLPAYLTERLCLMPLDKALRAAHYPATADELANANMRLKFEELFLIQLVIMSYARRRQQQRVGKRFTRVGELFHTFYRHSLPFPLTEAQKRVIREMHADMKSGRQMNRLLQGDVGSGKTLVALMIMLIAIDNGEQTCIMAPTEILAEQHLQTFRDFLGKLPVRVELLTGNVKGKKRAAIEAGLRDGSVNILIGTHAVIEDRVQFGRLGMVVVDEQHRFGVRQRTSLQRKGELAGREAPHVLVMSATPIPRTLALILYGDLSLSVVDELPPGRQPVKTRLVPEEKRNDLYEFVRKQVSQGQQAYVVCPLVESSEDAGEEVRSAREVFEELQGAFSHLRVGLTWGAQKSEEKTSVLRAFKEGQLDVLVSTTVIEVGVNVPAATVMIIENAERYGLSQLHQLRGRVGRGSQESWCFLLAKSNSKLKVLCETNDGFVVAQKDLELRGPGDLMGTRQSGESLHGILLDGDTRMLEEVSACVRDLYHDPALHGDRLNIEALATQFALEQHLSIARN